MSDKGKASDMEPDDFDMHQEERLWPTPIEPEDEFQDYDEADAYAHEDVDEDYEGPNEDMDGDHESALASAGFGTDEDYGSFGGEDDWLDGSYEE